ncbi:MAG: hypothetical protein QOG51_103 [Verrucomicrobiota bacterium]
MMRRLGSVVVAVVALAGLVGMVWSAFSLTSHALFLSRHGIEKSATILKFLTVSGTPKGGYNFYYLVSVDGTEREHSFGMRLRPGSTVSVLVSPSDPDDFILGKRGDSAFDVFAHEIGSRGLAYLVAVFYPGFFLILLPLAVRDLRREHRAGGGLFRPKQRGLV